MKNLECEQEMSRVEKKLSNFRAHIELGFLSPA